MTRQLGFIKATLLGGILFLVPIVLLTVILKRAYKLVHPPIDAVAQGIVGTHATGIVVSEILAIVLLVLLCFLAGLLSTTLLARRTVRAIENTVLMKVPGYELIKSAGESMAGFETGHTYRPVLARVEDAWQIGFLVEEIDAEHAAIIIPNVPSPWSGALYIMPRDRFREVDLAVADTLNCLKRGGLGSSALLRGKMPSAVPA